MDKTSPFLRIAALLVLGAGGWAGSLAGCGGGGTGGAADGCFDYTSFDGASPKVSFSADVLPIFRNSCGLSSSCHGSENGPSGQHYYGPKNSDPDPTPAQIQEIFDQSVNQPAVANPTMKIIEPGDPSQSFMMYKLDGDPMAADQVTCSKVKCATDKSCGSSMPQGGPALPEDKLDVIRRWIAQGAKND